VSVADGFWSELPLGRGVAVLAHDANGVAAFDKPAGVLSHPNRPADESRSLLCARYRIDDEVFEWACGDTTRRLWLLNRLDSATSGVILLAADGVLAAEIRAQFRRKEVRKVYHALVFGVPRQAAEVWRDTLAIEKKAGRIRTAADAGRVPAESRMALERAGGATERVALLRLEPRTGRSHQLRVQCARRGLPIVGDQTYGDFARNRAFAKAAGTKRMFLHSSETQFRYRYGGVEREFVAKAPLPPEFGKVF
jgi:23S rRNA pseudouridine955/2504/2580 synthase